MPAQTIAPHRVLLFQLPPPSQDGLPPRENHPVGAACLALWARRSSGSAPWEIRILEPDLADRGSDRSLIDAIVAWKPQVIGASLFVWNLVRSTFILREVRRRIPGILVVAGGPEVVPARPEIFGWGIDAAVPGEGEVAFAGILDQVRLTRKAAGRAPGKAVGKADLTGVPGILLPPRVQGGPPQWTGPVEPLASLDVIGNPYLEGLIDARRDRFLYLEATRGCTFRCTFCRYDAESGGPVRVLSLSRVEEVLRHAAAQGVREVFLLDPTLNQRRDCRDLLRTLARGNPGPPGRKLWRYGGELAAELVDREMADLLQAAGFHTVEAGLQSMNPATLRTVRRFHHRERFLRGVKLLRERGIRVRVDLVVGLPEETLETMKGAIDLLASEGIGDDVQVFELMVLPGTVLAGQAKALGMEHLPHPPYTVIRTPTMDAADIAEAVAWSEDRLGVSWTHRSALRRWRKDEKIVIRPGEPPGPAIRTWRRNHLAIDGRSIGFDEAVRAIGRPLRAWIAESPFASLDVLLRADGPGDLEALEDLVQGIQAPDWTLGAAVYRRVWILVSPTAHRRIPADWLDEAGKMSLVRFEGR